MGELPFYDLAALHDEIADALAAAADRVVRSGHYILGREGERFEEEFAAYCGVRHCVGVGNGLDALTLILRALGIGQGDEVIVPDHTCVATWMAVSLAGATPVPVAADATYTLDPAALAAAITPRTRAIIPVHLYGHPADMDAIAAAAGGIPLIEDAAQGHGARYKGRRVGGLGLAAAFSFYPSKNLGALGDGGAVTTNDETLAVRLRLLRNYGSPRKYVHDVIGCNSRLDELQAALLSAKLPHLDRWNEARRVLAMRYADLLDGCPQLTLPQAAGWAEPVWHQYAIRCSARDALQAHLEARGIGTMIHYPIANHLQGAYAGQYPPTPRAACAALAGELLSLPISPALTHVQVDRVAGAIGEWCAAGEY